MTTKRKLSISIFVATAFFAGILFSTAGANWLDLGSHVGESAHALNPSFATEPSPSASAIDEAFVSVADLINPSVVQIRSEIVQERQAVVNPFEGLFDFPNQFQQGTPSQPTEFRSTSLGSGVIISNTGHIVTNYHVIKDAQDLEVKTFNGDFYKATVVGSDPNTDLAVLQISETNLPAVQMANPSHIRVGQWVMAFGSPLDEALGNTVTSGIVSAVRRTSSTLSGLNIFSSFIQTDAAINPGNSGGALVDLSGKLIGINSAILSRSGGNQGIGFAIPVDVVQNITTQLIENGRVERGFLGVNFDRVSPSLAKALDVPRGAAQITSVSDDSPAQDAGLQDGDIIIAVNGLTLNDFNELRTTIANLSPGETVSLEVAHNNGRKNVKVVLGKRSAFISDDQPADATPTVKEKDVLSSLGMNLEPISDNLAKQYGLTDAPNTGLIVTAIDQNSSAFREGDLRVGDIILEINRKKVSSKKDFQNIYEDIENGKTFLVQAQRATVNPDRTTTMRSFLTALTKTE